MQRGGGRWEKSTACAVKETVACFDGIVDLVGARVVVDLPEPEPDQGHRVTAAELDGGRCHRRRVESDLARSIDIRLRSGESKDGAFGQYLCY